jgi:hypothetical protein
MKTLVPIKKLKSLLLAMSFLMFTGLSAQDAILSSGGDISTASGLVSYSVGQVFYEFQSGTSGSVTYGVQQPYEIQVISGIEEATEINLFISVFPNPATDFLTLKIDKSFSIRNESLSYQLFSIQGKLLATKNLEASETGIAMNKFEPGIYLLKIIQGNKEIKTFKIIKSQ